MNTAIITAVLMLTAGAWPWAKPIVVDPSFEKTKTADLANDASSETMSKDHALLAKKGYRWRAVAWGTANATTKAVSVADASDAPSGRRVAQIFNEVNQISALAQNLDMARLEPGRWYEMSAMIRCENLTGQGCHLNLEYWYKGNGQGSVDSEHLVGTVPWTKAVVRFQAPSREYDCVLSFFAFGGPGKVWVDDVRVWPIEPPTPDYSRRRVLDGPFWGMFTCYPRYLHQYGPAMKEAGVYWQREGTCSLAPEQQAKVTELGMAFEMCFDGMPGPKDPADPCYPVTDSAEYLAFVNDCLAKAGPAVRVWEIFNEPNTKPAWTLPGYANLLKLAGEAIKAKNPDAVFGTGGFTSPMVGYTEGCLKRGADKVLDVVLIHPYAVDEALDSQFVAFAEMFARCGRADLALAVNETGFPTWDPATGFPVNDWFVSEAEQASRVVKLHIQSLAHKLSFVTYLGWNDFDDPKSDMSMNMGLVRVDGSPKPSYHAYKFMTATIGDRRIDRWSYGADGTRIYRFGDDKPVWVVWNALRDTQATVDVGERKVFVCDPYGTKLTVTPVTGRANVKAGNDPVYLVPVE